MGGAGETPTARIVAEAWAPLTVVDAQGRRIEFRRPGALDRLRLFKALQAAHDRGQKLTGTVQAGGMALRPKGPAIQDAAMRKGRTRFQ